MYLDNQYTKQYLEIISSAIQRIEQSATRKEAKKILIYTERHHIIPKSLGGNDDNDNLVWLTAEEHLTVHLLLPKMMKEEKNIRKMTLAAVRMANPQSKTQKRIIGDKFIPEIALLREEAAKLHSEYMKEKHKGKNNPFYGKKHSKETKEKLRISTSNRIITEQMRLHYSDGRKNFYERNPDKKPTGNKNPKFDATLYDWENIYTGESITATRFDLTNKYPKLKSNISQVIKGNYSHVCGWRIVKHR